MNSWLLALMVQVIIDEQKVSKGSKKKCVIYHYRHMSFYISKSADYTTPGINTKVICEWCVRMIC